MANYTTGEWARKPCLECDTIHVNKMYCSRKCKGIADSRRMTVTDPVLLAERKAKQNEVWMRYYAQKRDQTPTDVDVKALQEIYKNCPSGHEVDHIIPISKGGLHSPENLQYLTIAENRSKSDKIL